MATEPKYVVRDKRALVNKVDGEKNVSRYIIFFALRTYVVRRPLCQKIYCNQITMN